VPLRLLLKFRSSVSAKIALIVTVPVVLMTSLFSYHHYTHDRDGLFHGAESQLLSSGEGLKWPIEALIKRNDLDGIRTLVDQAVLGADIELITLFDSKEEVVYSNKKEWIRRPILDMVPAAMTVDDITAVRKALSGGYSTYNDPRDGQYCLVMPMNFGAKGMGALFIGLNIRSVQAEIKQRAIDTFLASVAISVLIGISLYFLFHFLFTRRVKSVAESAMRFASGHMETRAKDEGTDEIAYLATSFNLLAEEITNWRDNLEEMASNRLNELLVLFDIVNTISQSLDLNTVLPTVLDRVLENMSVAKGTVVLVGNDGRSLDMVAQRGLSEESIRSITESGLGYVGDVILRNKPMRVSENEDESSGSTGLEQDNVVSALVVPISARGVVLGVLAVYSGKKDKFTDENEALLAMIGNQVSVAVLNAQLYQKTLDLAQHDGLTGLANRRYLMERLKQEMDRAERYETSLSVIMLDLDKFKSFNDSYGHVKGDELLKAFAAMVRKAVRSTDIAGRYGGEEFCVVLPNTSVKGAQVIAERIRSAMEALRIPLEDGQPPVGRTASIGVAEFSSRDSIEQLLSHADAALYRAKEGGRNRVVCS
jgi:diguanylate cyclase (GGDEF)-like protein